MEPIAKRPVGRPHKTPKVDIPAKPKGDGLRRAAFKASMLAQDTKLYRYPVKPPAIAPGVVPAGVDAPVMSMDANPYTFASQQFPGGGFPGFAYLSQLATRAEFRQMASALATELTREWLEFTSKQDDDTDSAEKIKLIEAEFKRLNVRAAIQTGAEHDCYFGRAQIFLEITGSDRSTPLILDPRTVAKGSFARIIPVEAVWTTPAGYNALDPVAPDFYKPSKWFMLGQEVHASRLMTIVTRLLPDILKPAFNFSGMSLSQLAEPYVDNWLRTRQSVADLINNFSITALATSMDQVLQGEDDGADLMSRAELFTAMRSNKGLMLLDKDREELVQINTPLSGLHELQAQSQEQMCSVSRMPAVVLTGISPSGLNASSDGEIRIFYDWIAAQQEAHWREPLEVILKAVQLSLFGEIDPDIGFTFTPLYQMTPKEESEIRLSDSQADCAYIAAGVVDPSEVRDRLAKDPASGYMGLDADAVIVPPVQPAEGETDPAETAQDADKWITVHPNGGESTGTPVLIGENGEVKGGMGGKFNGKNIKDAHGTKNFTSGETNKETEERNKPAQSATKSAPSRPDWYQKMRDEASNPYWNGKVYGTTGKYNIYIDGKKHSISNANHEELKQYMADKEKYDKEQKPIIEAKKQEEKKGGTYLHVPYDNREEAKSAGAKWDADKKQWYVPSGKSVPDNLSKYTSESAYKAQPSSSSSKKMSELSVEELRKKAKNYDLGVNEGGDGYNPFTEEINDRRRAEAANSNEPRQHHWAYSEEAVQRALRGEDSMPDGMGEDVDPDESDGAEDPANYKVA